MVRGLGRSPGELAATPGVAASRGWDGKRTGSSAWVVRYAVERAHRVPIAKATRRDATDDERGPAWRARGQRHHAAEEPADEPTR